MKKDVELAMVISTSSSVNNNVELVIETSTSTWHVLLFHMMCLCRLGFRVFEGLRFHGFLSFLRFRSLKFRSLRSCNLMLRNSRFHILGFRILSFQILSYFIVGFRSFHSVFLRRFAIVVLVQVLEISK